MSSNKRKQERDDTESSSDSESSKKSYKLKKKIIKSRSESFDSDKRPKKKSKSSTTIITTTTSDSEESRPTQLPKAKIKHKHKHKLTRVSLTSTKSKSTLTRKKNKKDTSTDEDDHHRVKAKHTIKRESKQSIVANASEDSSSDNDNESLDDNEETKTSSVISSLELKNEKKVKGKQETFSPVHDVMLTQSVFNKCPNTKHIFYKWIDYMWDKLISIGTIDGHNSVVSVHRSIRLLRKPSYFHPRTFNVFKMPSEAIEAAYHAKLRNDQFYIVMNLLRSCDLLVNKSEMTYGRYFADIRLQSGLFCIVPDAQFKNSEDLVRRAQDKKKEATTNQKQATTKPSNKIDQVETSDSKEIEEEEESTNKSVVDQRQEDKNEKKENPEIAKELLNKWITVKQLSMLNTQSNNDWLSDILILVTESDREGSYECKPMIRQHAERLLWMIIWLSNFEFNRNRRIENEHKQEVLLETMKVRNDRIFRVHSLLCEKIKNNLFTQTLINDSLIFSEVKIFVGDYKSKKGYLKVAVPIKSQVKEHKSYYYPLLDHKGFVVDGVDYLPSKLRHLTTFGKSEFSNGGIIVDGIYYGREVRQFHIGLESLSITSNVDRKFESTSEDAKKTSCFRWNNHFCNFRDKSVSNKAEMIHRIISTATDEFSATTVIRYINELKTGLNNINNKSLDDDAKGEEEEVSRLKDLVKVKVQERYENKSKNNNDMEVDTNNVNSEEKPETTLILPALSSEAKLSLQLQSQFERLKSNLVENCKSLSTIKSKYTEFIQLTSQLSEIVKLLTQSNVPYISYGMTTQSVIKSQLFEELLDLHEQCDIAVKKHNGYKVGKAGELLSYEEKYNFAFQSISTVRSTLIDAYAEFIDRQLKWRDIVLTGIKFTCESESIQNIMEHHHEKFGDQSLLTVEYLNKLCIETRYPKDIITILIQYLAVQIIDPLDHISISYGNEN